MTGVLGLDKTDGPGRRGDTGRDLDRFATSVQRAPSICIHHAHQGMHLVKDAISQDIPSTLPLVQGRARHVRKAFLGRWASANGRQEFHVPIMGRDGIDARTHQSHASVSGHRSRNGRRLGSLSDQLTGVTFPLPTPTD
jgi:hypothetical protein